MFPPCEQVQTHYLMFLFSVCPELIVFTADLLTAPEREGRIAADIDEDLENYRD